MYAKTDQDISRYGFYNRTNLEQAIRGPGGFGYYRVGGSSDLNNPGIWGFVSPTLDNSTSTSVTQFDGKMTRQWLDTPGGPLGAGRRCRMAARGNRLAAGPRHRDRQRDRPGLLGRQRQPRRLGVLRRSELDAAQDRSSSTSRCATTTIPTTAARGTRRSACAGTRSRKCCSAAPGRPASVRRTRTRTAIRRRPRSRPTPTRCAARSPVPRSTAAAASSPR